MCCFLSFATSIISNKHTHRAAQWAFSHRPSTSLCLLRLFTVEEPRCETWFFFFLKKYLPFFSGQYGVIHPVKSASRNNNRRRRPSVQSSPMGGDVRRRGFSRPMGGARRSGGGVRPSVRPASLTLQAMSSRRRNRSTAAAAENRVAPVTGAPSAAAVRSDKTSRALRLSGSPPYDVRVFRYISRPPKCRAYASPRIAAQQRCITRSSRRVYRRCNAWS